MNIVTRLELKMSGKENVGNEIHVKPFTLGQNGIEHFWRNGKT